MARLRRASLKCYCAFPDGETADNRHMLYGKTVDNRFRAIAVEVSGKLLAELSRRWLLRGM